MAQRSMRRAGYEPWRTPTTIADWSPLKPAPLSEKGAPLAILTYRLRVFRAGRHPLYGRPEFAQPAKEARFARLSPR